MPLTWDSFRTEFNNYFIDFSAQPNENSNNILVVSTVHGTMDSNKNTATIVPFDEKTLGSVMFDLLKKNQTNMKIKLYRSQPYGTSEVSSIFEDKIFFIDKSLSTRDDAKFIENILSLEDANQISYVQNNIDLLFDKYKLPQTDEERKLFYKSRNLMNKTQFEHVVYFTGPGTDDHVEKKIAMTEGRIITKSLQDCKNENNKRRKI